MHHATQEYTDILNSLLRGEIAATETYQQALAKVGTEPGADELRQIHREHREAANNLRRMIHFHQGTPDQDSGAWGMFAKVVEGAAKIFGSNAALKALKEGEEHGVKTDIAALEEPDLSAEDRNYIANELLPQTREHIRVLDRLMT
jgi:Domain of unknown function (DUF2383)